MREIFFQKVQNRRAEEFESGSDWHLYRLQTEFRCQSAKEQSTLAPKQSMLAMH